METESSLYFVGAGGSVQAGVPVTGDLLQNVVKRIVKPDGGPRPGRANLLRFMAKFGPQTQSSDGRAPIIEVISFLDSCLYDRRPLDQQFDLDTLRLIRKQLTIELAKAVKARRVKGRRVHVPEDANPRERERRVSSYHRTFVRSLTAKRQTEGRTTERLAGDSIITTNYDTELDVALYDMVYDDANELKDVFLGSDFRHPETDQPAFLESEVTLDIFHLHGALNWLYCPRCSRIYVTAFEDSVLYLGRVKGRRVPDAVECHCRFPETEPVIVAPSMLQEITNPHLHAIWMNAYHALEAANRWIIIGYSLPSEDLAIRSLLYRALHARDVTGRETTIEVVNPGASRGDDRKVTERKRRALRRRYGDLLQPLVSSRIKYRWMDFKSYVNTWK